MDRKIALITGATAGIGLACARLLAKNNYKLILTGRRKERLENIKAELEIDDTEVICLNFDIQDEDAVNKNLDSLPQAWRKIDLLINNAGLAIGLEHVYKGNALDWNQMIDTNIKGLLYISKRISAWMVENKSGHIINLSSIAGKEAYPNGAVYCGTKHAVSAISKAMRIELAPHQIKVSTICPGAVETEFSTVRFKGNQEKADKVYEGFDALMATDIAETILFMATRPKHVNIDDLLIMPTAQASARDIVRD